jgi:hypothetical protein
VILIIFKITKIDGFAGYTLWWERFGARYFLPAAFKEHENGLFAARLPLLCFVIYAFLSLGRMLRVCNGITITFMHLIFRSSLPDPQSQNPRNSAAIPVVLLNQIRQIQPKYERLNATVIPLQTLRG